MTDDPSYRTYLLVFIAAVVGVAVAIPVVGNALPGKFGRYIPMTVGNDFVRDEAVRIHAMKQMLAPCVAFLGDSRTAFNIEATIIDQSLPEECQAQNYGFPTLTRHQILQLTSELKIREAIVVSLSETMLANETIDKTKEFFARPWLRWLYLGHQRFMHPLRTLGLDYEDWRWLISEKRWSSIWLEKRVAISVKTYERDTADLAASYFSVNRPVDEQQVEAFLRTLAAQSKRLIVVIPPSDPHFQAVAAPYNNGLQRSYWASIKRIVAAVDAELIDCSASCMDGRSGFGDSVHLNAMGAKQYSENLAAKIMLSREGD